MNLKADILIVDDEPANLRLLGNLLDGAGYQVRPTQSPQAALESALLKPPSLIISDVRMPGMTGFELCKRLKEDERTQNIPIIFVSSLTETEDRVLGFEAGGVDFISRPIQEAEVLSRVRTHVSLHQMQTQLEELVVERTAELRKTEQRFSSLVENAGEGIVVSQNKVVKYCNRQFAKLLEYSVADMLSKEFIQLIHPEDRELVMQEYKERLSGEKQANSYLVRLLTNNGQEKHSSVNSVRIEWEGQPATLVMVTDITQRRRAEEEARQQREILARFDRAAIMEQFSGSIAHELNQPLAGILSNAQACELFINRGKASNADILEIIADIVSDAKRAGQVIRNLRGLYQNQGSEFEAVGLNAMVQETVRMLHSEFVAKKVTAEQILEDELPPVQGNRIQLQQVLLNLITNAHEAMTEMASGDRTLKITTHANQQSITLCVTDSGPGIPADQLADIFEPMVTGKASGTGLGLAICSSIVQAHGGKMFAENDDSLGARVGFTLPT